MKSYLDKFNKLFKGKQSIEIEFFDEEPLSKKYVRYNQSGEVCRSPEGSNQATQRIKNGWQQINCDTYNCQYRQKNEYGKCACNRIGWLKFLIPNVSTDRIFLMKITGQTSINKLDDYIKLQKAQGKSIKGRHIIFLKQIEQSNSLGQTFNNYVLDILKKENVESIKQIPETTEKPKELSTNNEQNVNNDVVKTNTTPLKVETTKKVDAPVKVIEPSKEETSTTTTKKATTKSKSKKSEETKKETDNEVTLTYSLGKPYFSNMNGISESEIAKTFYEYNQKGVNFTYTIKYVDSSEEKGKIVWTSKCNEFVTLKEEIEIHVSNGSKNDDTKVNKIFQVF